MPKSTSFCTIIWGILLSLVFHQNSSVSAAKIRATSPTVSQPHTPSSRWPEARAEDPPLGVTRRLPPSPCSNPSSFTTASQNECAYYETCLEERYHCGKDGYPLGYGKTACESLTSAKERFDEAGQKWIVDKERCVQEGLGQSVVEDENRRRIRGSKADGCESIRTRGMDLTSQCFVRSGICGLGETNWKEIIDAVGKQILRQQKDTLLEDLKAEGDSCKEAYEYFFRELNLWINHES